MDINKDDRAKALLEAMNDCAKRIYEIGYSNGLMEGYNKCEREHANTYIKVEGYKEGLNDAWECAKRITLSVEKGGLSAGELTSIFYQNEEAYNGIDTVLKLFTPEEAIEKIKEYDEMQKANKEKNMGKRSLFDRVFRPTKEEKEQQIAFIKKIYEDSKEDRGCYTCVNCVHVREYPSWCTGEECNCLAGLKCDTVLGSVKNCSQYIEKELML